MAILGGIAAASALAGTVGGIANSISAGNASARSLAEQKRIADAQLGQAADNEAYQRAVGALINQRSVAGASDSAGSTLRYDPATNQWISQLGPLPQAAQTAADQAAIRQNTTGQRQAEFANENAALRAARAGPAADAAQRELGSFRPMGQDQLVGLLQQRATQASDQAYRPLVADTLRAFARSGTAAGPVLSQLGREQSDSLRKSLIDSQIAGMTGVDQINQSRRGGLAQNAAATSALASPSFQSASISPSDANKTMAGLLASKSRDAAFAPAGGMSGVNQASKQGQDAYSAASKTAGILPVDTGAAIGKELGAIGNPNSNLMTGLNALFGKGAASNANNPAAKNPLQWQNQDIGFGAGNLYPKDSY